ncbi:serine acetyltransferase, partial [Acinetobacter baumannii]
EGEDHYVGHTLGVALTRLRQQVLLELGFDARVRGAEPPLESAAAALVGAFARRLPAVRELLDSDVTAAFQGDPAARSVDEVLLCYP